jgi:predicted XRE-type DNA-binding protein
MLQRLKMDKKLQMLIEQSKKMKKKSSLKYHEGYSNLLEATAFLPAYAHIVTRIWHVENNIFYVPKCKICNNNHVTWRKEKSTYNTYCCSKCARQDNDINVQIQKTNVERYGVKCAMNNSKIKQNIQQRWLEKYGVDNPSKSQDIKEKISKSNFRTRNKNANNVLVEELIEQGLSQKELGEVLGITQPRISSLLSKKQLKTKRQSFTSEPQKEICNFLKNNDITFEENKKIISPYHVDLYLPDHKIAIEFNGTFWHSETKGKNRYYHLNKTTLCHKQGITLIHIFEYDWIKNKELILSRLLHKTNKTKNINNIYARKCEVVSLQTKDIKTFYEKNHTQGYVPSKYNYGLVYSGKVVACMSFSVSRYDKNVQYELTRYAVERDHNVVGGASKLFTFATTQLKNIKSIVTYSENKWGITNFYEHLGFKIDRYTPPNYIYFHTQNTNITFSRIQFQKHKLKKLLEIYDPALSEWENMKNNGYDRIWDCGNIRWIWQKETPSEEGVLK